MSRFYERFSTRFHRTPRKETPADLSGIGGMLPLPGELSRNLFDVEAWQHYQAVGL